MNTSEEIYTVKDIRTKNHQPFSEDEWEYIIKQQGNEEDSFDIDDFSYDKYLENDSSPYFPYPKEDEDDAY